MHLDLAPDVSAEPRYVTAVRRVSITEPHERFGIPVVQSQRYKVLSNLSLDESHVAVCADGVTIDLWDVKTRKIVSRIQLVTGSVRRFVFAETVLVVNLALSTAVMDCLLVLDGRTLEQRNMFNFFDIPYEMAVSRDGLILAMRAMEGTLTLRSLTENRIYHVETGEMYTSETSAELKIEDEPGRSDGLVHVAVGYVWRMTRTPRMKIFALLCAPQTTTQACWRFLRLDGDHAVLTRVLGWLF